MNCWFTMMALRHCGRDYGSTRHNAYHFYRVVYHMTATEAWARTREMK